MALTKVIPQSLDLNESNTDNGLRMPSGTAFSGTPEEGMMRNNTDQSSASSDSTMQHYTGGNVWKNYTTAALKTTCVCDYPAGAGGFVDMEMNDNLVDTCTSSDSLVTTNLTLNYNATDASSYSGSGTTLNNISGSGTNNATVNGNGYTTVNAGEIDFIGTTANQVTTTYVFTQTNEFTFETWFYQEANAPSNSYIFADGDTSTAQQTLAIGLSLSQEVRLLMASNSAATSGAYAIFTNATYQLKTWTHVAMVGSATAGDIKVYIGGELKDTISAPTNFGSWPTTTWPFNAYISPTPVILNQYGAWTTNNNFSFNGKWGQTRWYDGALSAAEVEDNYNNTKHNYLGSGVNVTFGTGNFNKGVDFNYGGGGSASSTYIVLPGAVAGTATSDLSISFWFKQLGSTSSGSHLLCSDSGVSGGAAGYYTKYDIMLPTGGSAGKIRIDFGNGSSSDTQAFSTSTTWTDGNWHHLVYTMEWNSGGSYFDIKLYQNGVLDPLTPSTTSGQTVVAGDTYTTVGGFYRADQDTFYGYNSGTMDQLRFFNTALSQAEIDQLYLEAAC